MKRSRFSETQIIAILKETDAGMKVEDVCRKHGISNATYYNWKSNRVVWCNYPILHTACS